MITVLVTMAGLTALFCTIEHLNKRISALERYADSIYFKVRKVSEGLAEHLEDSEDKCDKGCDFCEHTRECMPSKE